MNCYAANEGREMDNEEFLTVPILVGFDHSQVIGELKIRRDALPKTPEFVFAIGYRALEDHGFKPGEFPTSQYAGKFELASVAPVDDLKYLGYLKQVGKA
jgi:hypothetical protein